jgi:Tfp pilus assembly protein PilN
MDARNYPLKSSPAREKEKREGLITGLEDFFEQNGTNWDEIIVILSRKSVLYRQVWFPSTVKENLSTAIEFEIEKFSPFKKEEVLYDYKVAEEASDGSRICILLNLIKRKDYEDIIDIFRKFAIKPTAIIASPAVWEGVDWLFSKNSNTDTFLIIKEGEDLILNTYSSKGLMDSVLYENSAHFSEDVAEVSTGKNGLSSVFLWGDGLEEHEGRLKEKGVKTFMILPSQIYDRFRYKDTEIYDETFIPALCASEVIEKVPDILNLIPIKDRPKRGRHIYYTFWVLLVLVFLSLFLLSSTPFLKRVATIDHLERRLSSLSVNVDEILKKKGDIESCASRLNEVEKIHDINPIDVLKELTLVLPEHTWLNYFRQKGDKLELGGISESATSLISILESSLLFRDVSFSSPVVKNREGTETFRLSMYLE